MERPQPRIQDGSACWTVSDRWVSTLAYWTVAALMGGGLALQLVVASECLPRAAQIAGVMPFWIIVTCFTWAATDPWIPQRLVNAVLGRICTQVLGRAHTSNELHLLRPRGKDDATLGWLLVGGLAGVGGLCQLLMIPLVSGLAGFNTLLADSFLWTPQAWAILQFALVAILLFCPSILLGMMVAALGAACTPHQHADVRGSIPLMWVGAALAIALWTRLEPLWAGSVLAFLLAAVPYFAASIVGFLAASIGQHNPTDHRTVAIHPPERIRRDRFLIAAGLLAWAGLAAMWITRRSTVADTPEAASFLAQHGVLPFSLLAGLMVGEAWMLRRRHSRGGAGIALWALGFATVLGAGVQYPSLGKVIPAFLGSAGAPAAAVGRVLAGIVTGFTLPYLVRCLAKRYSSSTIGHCVATSCVFAGAVIGILLVWTTGHTQTTARQMMMLLSLATIAVGGALIIHEPETSGRRRTIRLAIVFSSIALLMLLFKTRVLT